MRKFLVAGAIALAAMVAMPQSAAAVPIVGNISFGGDGGPIGSATWYQSTGVDFINPWLVTSRDGNYAPIPVGTNATFTDINYGGGTGIVNVPLAQTIWTLTFGGITYTLNAGAATNIDRGSALNDNISVSGIGTLTITGFDPTPGTWNFTGGFTGQSQNLSFSSAALRVVPEPGLLALLGLGLLGVARRYRK